MERYRSGRRPADNNARMVIISNNPITYIELKTIPEPNSGCWLWTGAVLPYGYGIFCKKFMTKETRAHRLSWEAHRGPIPEGLCVLHRCDNPACCNPDHLFLGTKLDNSKDCNQKGRFKSNVGINNPRAKLSEDQVRVIHLEGGSQIAIARKYGVSQQLVSRIKAGGVWKAMER